MIRHSLDFRRDNYKVDFCMYGYHDSTEQLIYLTNPYDLEDYY